MCKINWLTALIAWLQGVIAKCKRLLTILVIAAVGLLALGCTPAVEERSASSASPLRPPELGYVIVVYFDMSGSYADKMAKDGKAWQLMTRILDKYFRDRLSEGTTDKLIIGQLSAAGKKAVLFEDTPLKFRQAFATPEAFRDWLLKNSDPNGSRLYDGIREGIDYLVSYPGVADGKTRTAVLVASDMDDNASVDKGINYLLGSLTSYAKMNGTVALYFVEHQRVELWNRELKACGFKSGHFVVQSEIVQSPDLPEFDQ